MAMAKRGKLTPEMAKILEKEPINAKKLIHRISLGKIVIIPNKNNSNHVALGDELRSKLLCNTGTSTEYSDYYNVLKIAKKAEKYGASILCDQSTGPKFIQFREELLNITSLPVASIPLYQNAEESLRRHRDPLQFSSEDILKTFEEQIIQGVSAPGIHPITKNLIKKLEASKRLIPFVSRGGTILSAWIKENDEENPYISNFNRILDICVNYDIPLTFVCATRSGCLADGLDYVQISEWKLIGELVKKAHNKNVGVIVDGIGHLRIDKIPKAVIKLKKFTHNIPIGVMGPSITDRGLGYEHISHVIGAAFSILNGANYCQVCCRTEHIGLPEYKDVIEALRTYKIAIYGADLAKFPHLQRFDNQISKARCANQWGKQLDIAIELSIARKTFNRVGPKNPKKKGCAICGELCPFKIINSQKEVF